MSEEEKNEEEIQLPEEKTKTEVVIEEMIDRIEKELPSSVNYLTGIMVDDDMNVLGIKNGKLCVGKQLENCTPIREYMKDADLAYLLNALYIMNDMVEPYKLMWSGELERRYKKALRDIL